MTQGVVDAMELRARLAHLERVLAELTEAAMRRDVPDVMRLSADLRRRFALEAGELEQSSGKSFVEFAGSAARELRATASQLTDQAVREGPTMKRTATYARSAAWRI